jgi:hypothetical protein
VPLFLRVFELANDHDRKVMSVFGRELAVVKIAGDLPGPRDSPFPQDLSSLTPDPQLKILMFMPPTRHTTTDASD